MTPVKDIGLLRSFSEIKQANTAKAVEINLTTLGYTLLIPGVVMIRGISTRYSCSYRLLTVTHTLDRSGYTSTAMGTTYTVADIGVTIPQSVKTVENQASNPDQVLIPSTKTIELRGSQAKAKEVQDMWYGIGTGILTTSGAL